MTDVLTPCPFCGSANISVHSEMRLFSAWCMRCDAEGPINAERENAIALWNRRAAPFFIPLPVIDESLLGEWK